jgi:ubiquitin C-terminal hydrolase
MFADLSKALLGRRRAVDSSIVAGEGSNSSSGAAAGTTIGSFPPRAPSGFVGLQNLGATCYLNSLIQVLFHTGDLRKAIFEWGAASSGSEVGGVTKQLECLFAEMQLSAKSSVGTAALTRAFGWTDNEAFMQHDVHECMAVMLEALQRESADSALAHSVQRLIFGSTEHYVCCLGCGYRSTRIEPFSSLLLPIAGCGGSLYGALNMLTSEEVLDGDNKYACDGCSTKQDALKGVRLHSLPPVLFLHLNRFEFDFNTLQRRKLYDRVEVELSLDLAPFVNFADRKSKSASDAAASAASASSHLGGDHVCTEYSLVAVMMHVGGAGGGHYTAFVKTTEPPGLTPDPAAPSSSQWLLCNDSSVTRVPEPGHERRFAEAAVAMPSSSTGNDDAVPTLLLPEVSESTPGTIASPAKVAPAASSPVPALGITSALNEGRSARTSAAAAAAAKSQDAATGAYMLVYRRVDTLAACNAAVPVEAIDAHLCARISGENERYLAARQEWEAERRKVRVRLRVPSPLDSSCSLDPTAGSATSPPLVELELVLQETDDLQTALKKALGAAVAAKLVPECEGGNLDLFRLRYYDALKNVPLAPVSPTPFEAGRRTEGGGLSASPATNRASQTQDASQLDSGAAGTPKRARGIGGAVAAGSVLILERRMSADVPWNDWVPGSVPVVVVLHSASALALAASVGDVDLASLVQQQPRATVLLAPHEQSVGGLRRRCLALLNVLPSVDGAGIASQSVPLRNAITSARLVLLQEATELPAIVLSDDSAPLFGGGGGEDSCGCSNALLLPAHVVHAEACWAETDPFSSVGSALVERWDRNINAVDLQVQIVATATSAAESRVISIDQRSSLAQLRSVISAACCLPEHEFQLRRSVGGVQLKEPSQTLAYFGLLGGGACVVVTPGATPLLPHEFEVKISLAIPPPADNATVFIGSKVLSASAASSAKTESSVSPLPTVLPLGTLTVNPSMKVSDVKAALEDRFGPQSSGDHRIAADARAHLPLPSASQMRLRDRNLQGAKLTRVHPDEMTLAASCAAGGKPLLDNRELVVQVSG